MCKFCDPILGSGGFVHTEAECPLKQGCYCPVCGPGTHFPIDCPHKPKRVSRFANAIRSDTPTPIVQKTHIMADLNTGYVEYLKQHGLEIYRKQEDNRAAIARHLMSRAPPLVLTTHKIPSVTVKSPEEASCGLAHAENESCMVRKLVKKNKPARVETHA